MSGEGKSGRHALEAKKLAMLEQMLKAPGAAATAATAATAAASERERAGVESFPLSFAQERLFVLEQLYETKGAYNIPILAKLTGRLSVARLEAAFQYLMDRHDALRLSMKLDREGAPSQSVERELAVDFQAHDLQSAADPEAEAQALAGQQAAQRFPLDRAPLWCVRLYQVGDEEHRVLLSLHHIIADGGSLAVLLEELVIAYEALGAGRPPPLPPPPHTFREHVEHERSARDVRLEEKALEYVRGELRDTPDHLAFGARARDADQFAGDRQAIRVSRETTERLKSLARDAQATLFMVLLAAYELLLYRISNQARFLVAAPVANRTNVEAQRLVGFFVNTLLLRADLTERSTFRELLAKTRSAALAAFEHQETPFARIVKELNPHRDLERQPLAQVMFVLQNTSFAPVRLSDLSLEIVPFHNHTAKFDLLLDLHEEGGGLAGYLEYRTASFSALFGEQFAAEYRNLLDALAESPDRALRELIALGRRSALSAPSLVSREVLVSTGVEHTLHTRFEKRARERPDAVALSFEGRHLSYRRLDERANQLARWLRARGVRRGDAVGIFLPRSPEMVMSVLAIMKTGAAYVPLDPIYPQDRLRHILESSGCALVIDEETLATALRDFDRFSTSPLAIPVSPDNAAYIVYTSGSTGAPKGVIAHHRGALNHLDHVAKKYKLGPSSVILQCASLISDASLDDLLGPLIAGSRVVLVPTPDARDPRVLLRLIEHERATAILASTPKFLVELALAAKKLSGDRRALELIFVNGEPLAYEECALVREGFGSQARVINQYGPTEAAITQTEFAIDEKSPRAGRAPLGWALSNVDFSLLDPELRHVVGGMPGEAHLGGVGLAHGYRAQPATTAERFIPNPNSSSPGARIYRTGDRLVATKGEGFCFVGRLDHQVKIRGYRIEPAEIEAAIERVPGVASSVVVAKDDPVAGKILVAYFTSADGDISDRTLRASLKDRLSSYMIPSIFMRLDALPLTPNGKIDRAALPEPVSEARARSDEHYVRPRDARESEVCALFEDILLREPVGRDDNFFELGGHSLAAIRLVSSLSERVGFEVPLRRLFLHPTPAELVADLQSSNPQSSNPQSSIPHPAPRAPAEPLQTRSDVRVHRRSLLEQVRTGELPRVHAAALSTFPNELRPFLEQGALATELASISDTAHGRIASIWIPIPSSRVYSDGALISRLVEATSIAEELGASVVSLTGLLGSATAQGVALARALAEQKSRVRVTTGHATTVASIVLAVAALLKQARRELANERVAILGVGSIGTALAETFAATGLRPRELLLCDVYAKREAIAALADRVHARAATTDDAYGATLIIGATNAEGVLDVARLQPGTLIADDSAPYCFEVDAAWRRIAEKKDLLITTGGLLQTKERFARDLYLPEAIEAWIGERELAVPLRQADILPACSLSALLTATDASLPPTLGLATGEECKQHLAALEALSMTASRLQFSGQFISSAAIAEFAGRYS